MSAASSAEPPPPPMSHVSEDGLIQATHLDEFFSSEDELEEEGKLPHIPDVEEPPKKVYKNSPPTSPQHVALEVMLNLSDTLQADGRTRKYRHRSDLTKLKEWDHLVGGVDIENGAWMMC